MKRAVAVLTAASLLLALRPPAACATAPAADPFETVQVENGHRASHRWAYVSLAAGAGLAGLSFVLTDRANRTYGRYLEATDPAAATRLYDETARYDRFAAASLLTGEAFLAVGVWLRFLHRSAPQRASLSLSPGRCAVAIRF